MADDPYAYLAALIVSIEEAALAAHGVARELARDRMLDRRAADSLKEIKRHAVTIHHDIAKARAKEG
jgi:hypothetical protein